MKKTEIALGSINIENWKLGDPLYDDWMKDDPDYQFEVNLKEGEIILPGNEKYTLVIDYPLSKPFKNKFKTPTEGISRKDLIKIIVNCYHYVYDIEDRTSKIMSGHIENLYNRNETEGKYGIWGHDIGDLVLHTIWVDKNNVIELGVDS
jgi:hypothetical protein